jgi:hypothetical protein
MRLGVVCLGLLVAVAAQGQRNRDKGDDTAATKRACSVEECFFERDVRDFEVIDQTHVIVYTGSQRCAFHIELRGTMCDLTFAPELYFTRPGELPVGVTGEVASPFSGSATTRNATDPFVGLDTSRNRRDLRICKNDLSVRVHGGKFTEAPGAPAQADRFGNVTAQINCQVLSVESITDDQLMELYVARGVVPPIPPMGTGDIEVGEQEEQEE